MIASSANEAAGRSETGTQSVPAPETNPHDRTLRYMMPDFTIALAIGLVIGFILGYGPRATPSTRKTTIIPLLSLVCRTARPAAAPHGPNDCGDLPPLAVLKQYADGVATTRERPTATYRCTRTRRSRVPSRSSVERWRCQFWADCTTNISERKFRQGQACP